MSTAKKVDSNPAEGGKFTAGKRNEDSSESNDTLTSSSGVIDALLGSDATKLVWNLWESVKSNETIKQAASTLQDTQKQAHDVWNEYDADQLRSKLVSLGITATEYIDSADRKLESLEKQSLQFLQKKGSELVSKAIEVGGISERSGLLLFNGPEKTTTSRLDAELMTLHSSPERFLNIDTSLLKIEPLSANEQSNLLADNPNLTDTFNILVPAKINEADFWKRYAYLREQLIDQDKHRKQLIENQVSSNDLDDWGSSDEEDLTASKPTVSRIKHNNPTEKDAIVSRETKLNNESKASKLVKKIEDEGSDEDWE